MYRLAVVQYRVSRALGRFLARTAATLTLERMPPFTSTSALVLKDGLLLVVVDSILDQPILPGGHLAWRETPEEAVVREVREETGIEIQVGELVAVAAGEQWAGEPGVVRVVYRCEARGGTLRSSAEGRAAWVNPHDVASSQTRDASIIRRWLEAAGDELSARGAASPPSG
ncbi:MAG TPA: NUDIX hydrolase [Chloroflexota bacterium]|nr:NUDIX hydrolase [Chloroflexota bacterium]